MEKMCIGPSEQDLPYQNEFFSGAGEPRVVHSVVWNGGGLQGSSSGEWAGRFGLRIRSLPTRRSFTKVLEFIDA